MWYWPELGLGKRGHHPGKVGEGTSWVEARVLELLGARGSGGGAVGLPGVQGMDRESKRIMEPGHGVLATLAETGSSSPELKVWKLPGKGRGVGGGTGSPNGGLEPTLTGVAQAVGTASAPGRLGARFPAARRGTVFDHPTTPAPRRHPPRGLRERTSLSDRR